jgi:MFS family permease
MNIPLGIIAILAVMKLIPFYRLQVPKSFDFPGLLTVMISSLSLLIAFSVGHSWGWSSWRILSLFGFGVVVLILFIWRELKVETPLLNIRVFTNKRYSMTLVISSIITMSLYSGTFLTPIFLQNIQHVTPLDTGLILLPASLAMALCMPIVGKLYTIIGPRVLMIIGITLIAFGTLTLSWLSVDVSHQYIVFWMIVRNVGIALAMMPSSNAGMEQIPPRLAGHASSINNWVRNVFGSFAIALFTSLLASRSATHGAELVISGFKDKQLIQMLSFTMSVNDVYLVATFLAIAAMPVAFFISRRPRPSSGPLFSNKAGNLSGEKQASH